jgi:hypothetical protein
MASIEEYAAFIKAHQTLRSAAVFSYATSFMHSAFRSS